MCNFKQDLTYVQGKTYTALDDHAQASLHFILRATQLIFSKKKLGGKQHGRPSNTWFDSDCWEAQLNFHMVLNSSHPTQYL